MADMQTELNRPFHWIGIAKVSGVLLAELFVINTLRHVYGFECHTEDLAFCKTAKSLLVAAYGLSATLILLAVFARSLFADLLAEANLRPVPLIANLAGLGALVVSLPWLQLELSAVQVWSLAALWAVAISMMVWGAVMLIAPKARWHQFFRQAGWGVPMAAAAGAVAPFIGINMQGVWSKGALSDWTFAIVVRILQLWGQDVDNFPEEKVIGAGDFFVNIAPSCSGVEGLVLTTVFALIYLGLFRQDLRFPHALLILPIALLASWLLNSVRIAVLVQIGISGRPELAVGGFHSHAGWLMFTFLSLTIVLTAQKLPFLKKPAVATGPAPALPPLLSDPIVAQILPFFVFMASGLLASTFFADPATAYPMRALAMAVAVALVWWYFRTLPWRLDPVAIGVGVFIAVYWVAFSPPPETAPAYAEAGAVWAVIWVISRMVGTTLFVPLIEEVFFRGYLMDRIGPKGGAQWRIALGVIITTVLFAALHDRWIEAAFAGALFAWLRLRRDNITDPIIAHIVANGLIAAWAVSTGNWGAI